MANQQRAGIKETIEIFKEQNFYFKACNKGYKLGFDVYLGPETAYLGIFNQLVRTQSSYTFIYDKRIEEKKYRQYLEKNMQNKKSPLVIRDIKLNENISTNFLQFEDEHIRAFHVIKKVFSASFIEEKKLTAEYLKTQLNELKQADGAKSGKDDHFPALRLEEMADNKRIIVLISPVDGNIRLSVADPAESGIYNPISRLFENEFLFVDKGYERFSKKHYISMYEKEGYAKYPRSENNRQMFTIQFNAITKGNLDTVIKKSALSLQKYLSNLIFLMDLIVGPDILGRGALDKKQDFLTFAEYAVLPFFKYLCKGSRLYIHPEYDILFDFYPSVETDDNGNEFMISNLDIQVNPFENGERPNKGILLHPIAYELGK